MKIPISMITPNPNQPRQTCSGLDALAASIRQKGLLEPITVRPRNERYEIICGERRWRAARLAELKEIECVIREASDEEAFELALVENVQRENLTPMEEAHAFAALAAGGMKQKDIGKLVGKGQSYVAHKKRLAKLPSILTFFLHHGLVTENHVRQILRLKNIVDEKKGLNEDGLYMGMAIRAAQRKGAYPSKDENFSLTFTSPTDPEVEKAGGEYVLKHIEDEDAASMETWMWVAFNFLRFAANENVTVSTLTDIIDKLELDYLYAALEGPKLENQMACLRLLTAILGESGVELPDAVVRARADVAEFRAA